MTRIIVTKRSYDHHACIEEYPEVCANGVTVESAVRNLITAGRNHIFEPVEVVYKLADGFVEATLCQNSKA